MAFAYDMTTTAEISSVDLTGEEIYGHEINIPASGLALDTPIVSVDGSVAVVVPPSGVAVGMQSLSVDGDTTIITPPASGIAAGSPDIEINQYSAVIDVPSSGIAVGTQAVTVDQYSAVIDVPASGIALDTAEITVTASKTIIPVPASGIDIGTQSIAVGVVPAPSKATGIAIYPPASGIALDTKAVDVSVVTPPEVNAALLDYTMSGDADWTQQTTKLYSSYESDYGYQAGDITHGETSAIETTFTIDEAYAYFIFAWKVSSEDGYDFLRFYIDGSLHSEISGLYGWEEKTLRLETGEHTLKWSYEKDGSVSSNDDTAWIDLGIVEATDHEIVIPADGLALGTPNILIDGYETVISIPVKGLTLGTQEISIDGYETILPVPDSGIAFGTKDISVYQFSAIIDVPSDGLALGTPTIYVPTPLSKAFLINTNLGNNVSLKLEAGLGVEISQKLLIRICAGMNKQNKVLLSISSDPVYKQHLLLQTLAEKDDIRANLNLLTELESAVAFKDHSVFVEVKINV